MSDLYREIQQARGLDVQLDGLFAGTIAETASALTDLIAVTLDGWDTNLQFQQCPWTPRVHTVTINVAEGLEDPHNIQVAQIVMPSRGDRCLVGFDDSQRPWIIVWRPA